MGKICAGLEAPALQSVAFAAWIGTGMRTERNHMSAVLAGALIALGVQFLLSLLGGILGLSWQLAGTASSVPSPSQAVFSFASAIASFALGGYLAARIHSRDYRMTRGGAWVRGASVWALVAALYSFAPVDSASAWVRGVPRVVPGAAYERAGSRVDGLFSNPRSRNSMKGTRTIRSELVIQKLERKLRISRSEAASLLSADAGTTGEAAQEAGRVGALKLDFIAYRSWIAFLFLTFGCLASVLAALHASDFA